MIPCGVGPYLGLGRLTRAPLINLTVKGRGRVYVKISSLMDVLYGFGSSCACPKFESCPHTVRSYDQTGPTDPKACPKNRLSLSRAALDVEQKQGIATIRMLFKMDRGAVCQENY